MIPPSPLTSKFLSTIPASMATIPQTPPTCRYITKDLQIENGGDGGLANVGIIIQAQLQDFSPAGAEGEYEDVALDYSGSPEPKNNNPESGSSLFSLTSSPGTNELGNPQIVNEVNEFTSEDSTENNTTTKSIEGIQGQKEGAQEGTKQTNKQETKDDKQETKGTQQVTKGTQQETKDAKEEQVDESGVTKPE